MKGKIIFQNAVTAVLLLCAATVAISMIHREFFSSVRLAEPSFKRVDEWRDLAMARGATWGPDSAKVTILNFSDYECPFCKSLEPKLQALEAERPDMIQVIRFELPLTKIHRNAYVAALAGKCAAAQGVVQKFQKTVYAQEAALETFDWTERAMEAGVPSVEAFTSCLKGRERALEVDEDVAIAQRLGFTSTPTLIINGDVISGDQSEEQLRRLFDGYAKN